MSEKHEAFVRLSTKRLETIEDAIRIYSNLSGPSYEWTMDEVRQGFNRISEATGTALMRFTESRLWEKAARDEGIEPHEQPQEAPEEAAEPDPAPAAPTAPVTSITPRQAEMLRIWAEPRNEEGALLEMLAMQREVIAHLQSIIDGKDQA